MFVGLVLWSLAIGSIDLDGMKDCKPPALVEKVGWRRPISKLHAQHVALIGRGTEGVSLTEGDRFREDQVTKFELVWPPLSIPLPR